MRDSLRQLVLTRFREFVREPEALFWALAFPILLSIGLGIAFRNRPAEVVHVAVNGDSAAAQRIMDVLAKSPAVSAERMLAAPARLALRTGKVALVVNARVAGRVEYEYDDTRPDSRGARVLVNDVIQRGVGRTDPFPVTEQYVRDPGSRYIDF